MEIDVTSEDLVRYFRLVKTADQDVAKALRKRLTMLAKPIAEEVKTAALNLPSQHGIASKGRRGEAGLGLRAGMAAAVETKVNPSNPRGFSIRIRVSGSKFQDKTGKYKKLPRYMEGLSKRSWRHPVFATKGVTGGTWEGAWAYQKPKPFLLRTVIPHKEEVREQVYLSFIDGLKDSGLTK